MFENSVILPVVFFYGCETWSITLREEHRLRVSETTVLNEIFVAKRDKVNSMEEEVKERIALGIKAYYVNLNFFKDRLITRSSKLKLYRTVIRPIVTYATETWVLKENMIQKLPVFERNILRGTFGPTKENQIWRIKNNEELDKLIKHEEIINYFKAQRLSWFGHDREYLKPAKPSQAKVLTGGGDLREAQVDVPLSVSHSCV